MGFTFFNNLNPIRKAYISRISLHAHNHLNPVLGALSPPQLDDHSVVYAGNPNFNPVLGALSPPQLDDHSVVYAGNPNFRIWKRWHRGHSHQHGPQDLRSGEEGVRIFRLGLAADVGLATGKALTGYFTGSTAIIAGAAHSVSDVVLSGVALLSFKAARVPKDKEHPYGHGKFETLGALGISCVLLATAGGIAWHAIDVLLGIWSAAPEIVNQPFAHDDMHGHHKGGHHHGIDMGHPILALSMAVVSIGVKEGLYWITKRAGERVGSGLMKANAWHHRADAVSSIVSLIGVGGSILGVTFLDPLAGVVVSGMILKAGLETGYQSVLELVDAAIPSQDLVPYRHTILLVEGVNGCNHLRGRRAGSFLYLDVNVEVDPFSSVSAAHNIGESVLREIQLSHPEIAEVFVHIEPSICHVSPIRGQIEQEGKAEMAGYGNGSSSLECTDIEDVVSNILSSYFSENMAVERITHHVLQGQILFQIEVSMPPDILIRDAVQVAEEAKKQIMEAVSNNVRVSMLLRLGRSDAQIN